MAKSRTVTITMRYNAYYALREWRRNRRGGTPAAGEVLWQTRGKPGANEQDIRRDRRGDDTRGHVGMRAVTRMRTLYRRLVCISPLRGGLHLRGAVVR